MRVRDCMKQNVYSIAPNITIGQSAQIFAEKHIGTLPVVDRQGKLIGVLQLRDLLELVLPDFIKLLDDFDFAPDFGAVETRRPGPDVLATPISKIMSEPVSVEAESGLLRAVSMLRKYELHDLPVVDENGLLVGILSRVDAGTAFVARWNNP